VLGAAKEYNMLINAAKTKVMTNTDVVIAITVAGGRLEQVGLLFCVFGEQSKEWCILYRWGEAKDGYNRHDGDGQVDENVEK